MMTFSKEDGSAVDVDTGTVDFYVDKLERLFSTGNFSTSDDDLFYAVNKMDRSQLWLLASILSAKAAHYARLFDSVVNDPQTALSTYENMCFTEEAAGQKIWNRLNNPRLNQHVDHELKTHPQPFQALWDGSKRFEVRKNSDRSFCEGDILLLREYIPESFCYTGRSILASILYKTSGTYGLPSDLDVLSIDITGRYAEG